MTPSAPGKAAQKNPPSSLVLLAAVMALAVAVLLGTSGGVALDTRALAGVVFLVASALPVLALLWAAALGYGLWLRGWLVPGCAHGGVVAAGLGMAALLLTHWVVGVTLGVGPIHAGIVCGVGVVLLGIRGARWWQQRDLGAAPMEVRLPWTLVLGAAPLGLMLVAACCPPGTLWRVEAMQYDTLTYHLQLPRQWLALGRITGLKHNVYSYLPGLVESGYTMIGALGGGLPAAAYTCQLFHVSLAVYAAIAVGCVVATFVGGKAGAAAGALLLSVPWVMITASCAYNEMAVLAFGAAALLLMIDLWSQRAGGAAAIGLLVAAATLSKLTAGPMIAVPIGLMLLLRLNPALRWRRPPDWRTGVRCLAVATCVGLLTLSPYLIRNAVWAGNPVFPFAADALGTGHWTDAQADRWDAAHAPDGGEGAACLVAVARHWLFNTGYGGIGGMPVEADVTSVARFSHEYGFPVLWGAALLAMLSAMRPGSTRRIAVVMLIMLLAQVGFWLFATHLQSRFLVPLLLPTAVVFGLGLGRFGEKWPRLRFMWPVAASALPLVMVTVQLAVLLGQVRTIPGPTPGQAVAPPPGFWVDTLDAFGEHPINQLPPGASVLLVADNGPLLYLRPSVLYATPFDTNPLTRVRATEVADIADASVDQHLRGLGVTHVWVGWSEIDRLTQTHGLDPTLHADAIRRHALGWTPVAQGPAYALYALPREENGR